MIDSNVVAGIGAILLSLGFSYIPGLSDWYEKQTSQYKQLFMLGMLLLVVVVMFGLSWFGLEAFFTPDAAGAWEAVKVFGMSVVINAGAYKATNYIGKK